MQPPGTKFLALSSDIWIEFVYRLQGRCIVEGISLLLTVLPALTTLQSDIFQRVRRLPISERWKQTSCRERDCRPGSFEKLTDGCRFGEFAAEF